MHKHSTGINRVGGHPGIPPLPEKLLINFLFVYIVPEASLRGHKFQWGGCPQTPSPSLGMLLHVKIPPPPLRKNPILIPAVWIYYSTSLVI